ncbi:hypothetical protein DdX_10888 [Ditylenchus destructor]|uniref:Uncharacterized protein n=1 Tax=Ditylenchus destructor TaxID=166010 RepID=A0AAD4N3F4_9BILA|nr:hypothetical protein DdX_10888 [Ditylenchus destructor]
MLTVYRIFYILFLISAMALSRSNALSGDSLLEGAVSSSKVGQQSLDKDETRRQYELKPFIAYSERRFNGN